MLSAHSRRRTMVSRLTRGSPYLAYLPLSLDIRNAASAMLIRSEAAERAPRIVGLRG